MTKLEKMLQKMGVWLKEATEMSVAVDSKTWPDTDLEHPSLHSLCHNHND